ARARHPQGERARQDAAARPATGGAEGGLSRRSGGRGSVLHDHQHPAQSRAVGGRGLMAFVVDTTKFQAEGAVLNWNGVARRLGMTTTALAAATLPTVLELRWTLRDELGLPTEPFTVWRRDKKLRGPKPIAAEILPFGGVFFGSQVVDLKGSYATVELDVSGNGGVVYAFVGNPWLN